MSRRIIIEDVSNREGRIWLVNNIFYINDGMIIKPIINREGDR